MSNYGYQPGAKHEHEINHEHDLSGVTEYNKYWGTNYSSGVKILIDKNRFPGRNMFIQMSKIKNEDIRNRIVLDLDKSTKYKCDAVRRWLDECLYETKAKSSGQDADSFLFCEMLAVKTKGQVEIVKSKLGIGRYNEIITLLNEYYGEIVSSEITKEMIKMGVILKFNNKDYILGKDFDLIACVGKGRFGKELGIKRWEIRGVFRNKDVIRKRNRRTKQNLEKVEIMYQEGTVDQMNQVEIINQKLDNIEESPVFENKKEKTLFHFVSIIFKKIFK